MCRYCLLCCLVIFSAAYLPAQPISAFIKIDGIPGALSNSPYAGWSEISFTQQGLERSSTNTQPDEFTVQKLADKMSPRLLLACNKGTRLASVKMDFVRPVSTNLVRFYQVGLSNVLVTRYSTSGGGSDRLVESFGLDYTRIDWSYTEIDPRGQAVDRWFTWWDRSSNTGGEGFQPGFKVQALQVSSTSCQLTWTSEAGKVYEIRTSPRPDGPYTWLRDVVSAGDGETTATIEKLGPTAFYILREK